MNKGTDKKRRELDCAVINNCLGRLALRGLSFDTVRGAFLEGPPVFPGTTISTETHIQMGVTRIPLCRKLAIQRGLLGFNVVVDILVPPAVEVVRTEVKHRLGA